MIQAPQNYGVQNPTTNTQTRTPEFKPSYNAVQINLDTPTLNAPAAQPYYTPINNVPAYMPGQQAQPAQPATEQPQTTTPAPVLNPQQPAQPANVDVKPAETAAPATQADEAFKGLSSTDYDTQALAMEDIAKKGLSNEADAVPYVQENILDKLVDIMNVDTTNLAGPTDKQVETRKQIAENDKAKADAQAAGKDPATVKLPFAINPQDEAEANKLSQGEQAERNKEYAMFTTGILQKTYADEVEKQSGTVVPLTELPGAKAIITQLKTNKNPDIAVSAIDALRYVQRPEYKNDLTTVYTIAQSDSRPEVADAATKALASLNEAPAQPAAPAAQQPAPAAPEQQAQAQAQQAPAAQAPAEQQPAPAQPAK